jgi:hypothetical protein
MRRAGSGHSNQRAIVKANDAELDDSTPERDVHRPPSAGRRRMARTKPGVVELLYVFREEVANVLRDEHAIFLESKVAGVEQV